MKTFYVGIKGVIVRNGKVLLLRSNPEHEERGERWEMPGGRIDDDESITETLERELKEELPNIQNIQVGEILSAYRLQKDIWGEKSLTLIFYEVSTDFKGGEPHLSIEHTEYKWADHETAQQLIEENTKHAVKKALRK